MHETKMRSVYPKTDRKQEPNRTPYIHRPVLSEKAKTRIIWCAVALLVLLLPRIYHLADLERGYDSAGSEGFAAIAGIVLVVWGLRRHLKIKEEN